VDTLVKNGGIWVVNYARKGYIMKVAHITVSLAIAEAPYQCINFHLLQPMKLLKQDFSAMI